MIKLPDNHSTYVRQIKLRCNTLIQFGIWEGIDPDNLNLWWRNFDTEEEEYFAASILDALIYRSDKQVGAMIFELFSRKIPNLIHKYKGIMEYKLLEKLDDNWNDPLVRISAPIFNKPGQSGHQILRELKRKWVKEKWIINPDEIHNNIKNGVSTIIVVDDFSGTGQQIETFITENYLEEVITNTSVTIVFVCLCSHHQAREYLRNHFPEILFTSADFIKENYSCFNILNDGINTREDIKAFYIQILNKMGLKKPNIDRIYGRGNLELAYAFQQAVPNNSLNVLYHDVNWNPLFKR